MRRPHASAQHGAPPRDRHVGREGKALIKRHVTRLAETDRCWHRPPHIELSVRVSMSCELCDPFVSVRAVWRDEVGRVRGVRTPACLRSRPQNAKSFRRPQCRTGQTKSTCYHDFLSIIWLRAGVGTTCLRVVPVVADRRVTRLTRQSRLASTAARDRSVRGLARRPPSPHRACTSAISRESELRRGRPRQVEPAKPPARPRPDVSPAHHSGARRARMTAPETAPCARRRGPTVATTNSAPPRRLFTLDEHRARETPETALTPDEPAEGAP